MGAEGKPGEQPQVQGPGPQPIVDLINALGDDRYRVREEAQKKLIEIGAPALEGVKAALNSPDPEVKARAEAIVAQIERNVVAARNEAARKKLLWTFTDGGGIAGAPAALKDGLCLVGEDGKLYVLDQKGKVKLRLDLSAELPFTAAPAVGEGMAFVATRAGRLRAVDVEAGKIAWLSKPFDEIGLPAYGAGMIFIGGGESPNPQLPAYYELVAYDARTGQSKWTAKLDQLSAARPVVADGVVYVACAGVNRVVRAFEAAGGKEIWASENLQGLASGLAVANGKVYVSHDAGLDCLDAKTGKSVWHSAKAATPAVAIRGKVTISGKAVQMDQKDDPPAVADGVVYVASRQELCAVDAGTGESLWTYRPEGVGEGSAAGSKIVIRAVRPGRAGAVARTVYQYSAISAPTVADGIVCFGTGAGLCAVDTASHTLAWKFQTSNWASRPIVAGGVAYFGTQAQPDDKHAGADDDDGGGLDQGKDGKQTQAEKAGLFAVGLTAAPAQR